MKNFLFLCFTFFCANLFANNNDISVSNVEVHKTINKPSVGSKQSSDLIFGQAKQHKKKAVSMAK